MVDTVFYQSMRLYVNDLKEAHYFKNKHDLNLGPLKERYGNDLGGFVQVAQYLGGESVDMAHASYRFLPFPRMPLYYLYWKEEEFEIRISVLFDRSIERYFSASAIWALVNMVSLALLQGPADRMEAPATRQAVLIPVRKFKPRRDEN